jgi:beta,beta-carotene 9',10'-dioxygenase
MAYKQFILAFIITSSYISTYSSIHTHQQGFKSLKSEANKVSLSMQGALPPWLSGSFIAIGPAIFELNKTMANHWLDGFAMIHQFVIEKNAINYSNKLINSSYYQDCCAKGMLRGSAPAEKKSTWSKLAGALTGAKRPLYDNANINIACINNQLVALTETPIPVHLDATTLHTKGLLKFDDTLEAHFACAHPIFDSTTKEWFGVAIQYAHMSNYIIYKIAPNTQQRSIIATLPVGYPAYMHSFALTPHYIILIEAPFTVSPYDLLLSDHSFIENFTWQPQNGSNFIVIERKTGKKIGSYKAEAFFTLHQINAIEKDNAIIIDLIAYKNPDIITKSFRYANLCATAPYFPSGHLKRYTINPKAKLVTMQQLLPHSLELPHINSHNKMETYQYLYATSNDNGFANKLIKLDLQSKGHHMWQCPHCYPTEPIFIPNPAKASEDDGVILSLVFDAAKQKSFLLILDASTFKEIGRAYAPHHIPFTLHSNFF